MHAGRDYLNRLIFLEGKNKDYFYMRRNDLPPIPSNRFEPTLLETSQNRYSGGRDIEIKFTLQVRFYLFQLITSYFRNDS